MDSKNTLPPGDSASVSVTVNGGTLHSTFDIPQGQSGPPGEVTTSDMNTAINNAISGTSNNTNSVGTLSQSRQQLQPDADAVGDRQAR